ncbi:S8 family peptidase [Viscerimonas tarda]
MLKYKLFTVLLFLSTIISVSQAESAYKFRIYLNDKGTSSFSISNPQQYLSDRAIARRVRQHIPVDESDLPISAQYITSLEELGCVVVAKSKWLATITVHCADSALVEEIKKLDFVQDVAWVWKKKGGETKKGYRSMPKTQAEMPGYYGNSYAQIAIHNGDSLHRAGFRGDGMEIAVIDGGFKGLDDNMLLENILIRGRKNFIYSEDDDYEMDHGLRVLSCMATDLPGIYIGTAPEAQYWLLQSENPGSEYPVEEDYWLAAAEFADSVGVDVINTSLGYSVFDVAEMSYSYSQLDGKTTFISKGATMASNKGILVVGSAGNEGVKPWRYITAPGDSEEVLTVGAIARDSTLASFSSRGPASDFRTKPDVVAVGSSASTVTWNGYVGNASGTSFSSPIMCGLVTCLWQAYPNLTNKQLIELVRKSSDKYAHPDDDYGYGIPDMIKALDMAKSDTETAITPTLISNENVKVLSDKTGRIRVTKNVDDNQNYQIRILTVDGKTIVADTFSTKEKSYQLEQHKGSLYIVNISSKDFVVAEKVRF